MPPEADGDMYKKPHFRTGEHAGPGGLFSVQETRVQVKDICTFTHSLTIAGLGKRNTQTMYILSLRASYKTGEKNCPWKKRTKAKPPT